jgi:hypothetical protein
LPRRQALAPAVAAVYDRRFEKKVGAALRAVPSCLENVLALGKVRGNKWDGSESRPYLFSNSAERVKKRPRPPYARLTPLRT